MKTYLEITEVVTIFETPEFIRCDVTDKTEVEISRIKDAMVDIMSGKNYRLVEHLCRHDESGACTMEEL